MPTLPIDALLPEVLAALREGNRLVLEAAPGAGKTTRVPPALLDVVAGEVIVLEPRRMAARMAARRVAWERGEAVGSTVGYQVRFEEAVSAATRLRFVTEGILVRRLQADPLLRGVGAVALDEFHERHLDADLSLALLRRLQEQRPELKLLVMSATLDATPIAAYLGGCPVLSSQGRVYPLEMAYQGYSPQPLHAQVREALQRLLREGHRGHTLVFLPGAAEIRRAMRECEGVARAAGLRSLPLHGDLSPDEQDRAVAPSAEPKVIFSTNVAESSVTIESVTAVIDSGLARVASHSPWTGLPTLEVRRISQASARQRAGRAGRTAPGRVLRLYAEQDYRQRPEQDAPEILREDLSGLCLTLRAIGESTDALAWLDTPPSESVTHAEALLNRLGATGEMARKLARLPLPPRLARMVVEAASRGVGEDGCLAAALLAAGTPPCVDLLEAMDAERGLLPGAQPDHRVRQTAAQLRRLVKSERARTPSLTQTSAQQDDEALLLAVLAGFPDRVARRRAGREVQLCNGVSAEFAGEPPPYAFLVALDVEDRSDKPLPLVRVAARIEPEWLIDLFPERVREVSTLEWNREAERVEAVSSLRYDELVLQESRDARPHSPEAANLLADRALEPGLGRFIEDEAREDLLARAAFAGLPTPDFAAELRELCLTLPVLSFTELRRAAEHLLPALEAKLEARRLRELAPATLRLKAGRQVKVHYEPGKPPWIASRMQDFFGMEDGPRIGPDRMPVVMHLLGPNQRPVQQTADLRGFWQRLYPEVRRELMRRYPRHSWPEKPV